LLPLYLDIKLFFESELKKAHQQRKAKLTTQSVMFTGATSSSD